MILAVIVGLLGMGAVWAILVYNGLIRAKNIKAESWSGVDVQLKRRHELIPSLIRVVEGYAHHEKELMERIIQLRAQSLGAGEVAGKAEAENQLARGLAKLFAVAEAYPNLKANENFLALQKQWAEVEDQLQMARRCYNGAVREFNIVVDSFPGSLIAVLAGYRPESFFEISNDEKSVPAVSF